MNSPILSRSLARRAEQQSFRAASGNPEFGQNGRTVRYVLSTPAVARDQHTIAAGAWQTDNFEKNPVFLWAHDDSQLPIGTVTDLSETGGIFKGTVDYVERDLNPFADTVYQMVRAGYLNAVSVSWGPIAWKWSQDPKRPGGIDFTKVDLFEVSQVPVPAHPAALAEARSRGIDTKPIFDWAEKVLDGGGIMLVPRQELEELRRAAKPPAQNNRSADTPDWKVGASIDLPIEDSDDWDGAAAESSIFEWAGGDDFDPAKAKQAFLAYDAANDTERGSYKLPIAHVVDGELKVPKGAIRAAASRLPDTDIPDDVKKSAGEVLDHYKDKAGIGEDEGERAVTIKNLCRIAGRKIRSLYHVGWLAYLLDDLSCLVDCVQWEAAAEGDGSNVPAQMLAAIKQLGTVLVNMTEEEVTELLGGEPDDDGVIDALGADATDGQRAVRALAKMGRAATLNGRMAPEDLSDLTRAVVTHFGRAGRVLSAANEKTLRDAHSRMAEGCDMVRSVFEQVAGEDDGEQEDPTGGSDDDTPEGRAVRARAIQAGGAAAP